jgi:hypothetical protein
MALRRLPNAMRRVRYGSIRQYEMKICEAGPPHMRPNPIHLREAINAMEERGRIRSEPPPRIRGVSLPTFYFPPDFDPARPADGARRAEVHALYETFLRAGQEDQGKTLERVVFDAVMTARRAGRYMAVIGSPDRPPGESVVFNGVELTEALDLILVAGDGAVAVEDKNEREWLGPSSHEVWELIGKALRIDALPVLVCRKVTYDTFLLFKQIGALAYQMHGQLFPANFAARLDRVRHREGLGFADLRFGDTPPPGLIRFFDRTIPTLLGGRLELFRSMHELLTEYAINQGLEEDLPGDRRRAVYREFFRRLKGWDEYVEEPRPDWDTEL